ncbi:NADH-quinone oxidoreductase subunit D [Enemella evansiae]|uniref:NADH-quinone oxidoreductase subunit D n=1 Tax=Enemella evansiae TaxID=2016499 RepID=A0A255GK49_9ACTN|nr:NADH-quinone oxidoreductase subunit D [Enemella evansiae]PFG68641.1 NADH dehydrogenase subunit D [Propionibacteriaceae bacterium ES.041]OYN94068.1 NADH dehydrogenase subunit D [Enemella evansiae]OYN95353.1 NADH dehydrogenase subunit D [Enemella evansiae]OYO03456.1 NADH dehydrogenase subunit D [Enemella evansiae]OYO09880.1 NADH dehydrogenase subunit D [Enemella evansiae]
MSTQHTSRPPEHRVDDQPDLYGVPGAEAEGTVYTAAGQDWDQIVSAQAERGDELLVVNMGPQHPSTHGVLRLILEMEGETIQTARCGIGYLHTGIEKNMEYRTWTQGVTFCTRMDYLTPFYQEGAYVASIERLLGIEDEIPEKAKVIRVLLSELNRIGSHLVCIGTGGMEIGALTVMTIGFRDREMILDAFEAVTGLRMNHAYFRPGGVANDIGPKELDKVKEAIAWLKKHLVEYKEFCNANPIFLGRLKGVGYLDASACLALGITGPMLRSTGYDFDLRKNQPYWDYETYDFEVPTEDTCDALGKFFVRQAEMWQSLHIAEQCVERLEKMEGASVMVADPKIAWPAQLSVGSDGIGNSNEHIKHIMGQSMEALIHHFKLVTEGFQVPPGQAYVPMESPKGEIGAHLVSDGGTRPWRAHFRDPSFNNLQAVPALCEGSLMSDVVVAVASIDPVMGGVDR